jgi:hypothetical protein
MWDSNKEFVDQIAPFEHSNPDQWTLNKIVALSSYIGKTFTGVCSLSEFGKSSIYLILDAITQKCPVFQPRSVPGVLAQITENGNMVFDEVHDTSSDVKACMENFSLQVAGNSPVYVNGAMRSKHTKPQYDVSQQSITYLYNVYSNYSSPNKQFWNFIWSNTKAMESRFLCMKFDGKLLEKFDKTFDVVKEASDNKVFYINLAKHLGYLKEVKLNNKHQRRYSNKDHLETLKGRHKIVYDEITWLIDVYAQDQEEYTKFVRLLNLTISSYKNMLKDKIVDKPVEIKTKSTLQDYDEPATETVEQEEKTPQERVREVIKKHDKAPYETVLEEAKVGEGIIEDMKKKGDLFEIRPGVLVVL